MYIFAFLYQCRQHSEIWSASLHLGATCDYLLGNTIVAKNIFKSSHVPKQDLLLINRTIKQNTEEKEETINQKKVSSFYHMEDRAQFLTEKVKRWMKSKRKTRRRWHIISYPIFTVRQVHFMRC
jgi:hypothetical protein